ncbi:MAG: hypothetical protein ACOCNC_10055 [Acetivibrio ethanolgignens]
MMKDVNIVTIDFRNTAETEIVTENADGSFTIFINAKMSFERQQEAYQHAMRHIDGNDFEKTDVQKIEHQVRNFSEQPKPIPAKEYDAKIRQIRRRETKIHEQLEGYEKFERSVANLENNYLFSS